MTFSIFFRKNHGIPERKKVACSIGFFSHTSGTMKFGVSILKKTEITRLVGKKQLKKNMAVVKPVLFA